MRNLIYICLFTFNSILSQDTFDKRFNQEKSFSYGLGLIESKDYYISYGLEGISSVTDTIKPMFLVTQKNGSLINNPKINNKTCFFEVLNYQKTENNNFIGVGYTNTDGDTCGASIGGYSVRTRMYIHKLNSAGNIIWQKNYGDTILDNKWMTANDVSKTTDENYFILGKNSGNTFILKVNDQGDSITSKTYNFGSVWTDIHKIEKVQDGYLCFINNYAMKISEQLDSLWTKQININTNSIQPTNNNGFILSTNSYTYPVHSTILKKIDKDANIEWTQTYKANNIVNVQEDNFYAGGCVAETKDGNFVSAYKDIIKVNKQGDLLWRKRLINDNFFFYYNAIIETEDGGLLLTGRTGSTFQTILTKLDCNGNLEWNTNSCLLPTEEDILVFPNPMLNELIFQLPNISLDNNIKITIYNSIGQIVSETVTKNQQIITVNTNKYNSGIYLYSIYLNGEKYKTGKVIK